MEADRKLDRRRFLKLSVLAGSALLIPWPDIAIPVVGRGKYTERRFPRRQHQHTKPSSVEGMLDPHQIPKYQMPLVIPPVMPRTDVQRATATGQSADFDYYEISVRQFEQQILPPPLPKTTVWGYGSRNHPETFHSPGFTIEATANRPVRVKWINELINPDGTYLPHLLPVDQTLHWANPPGGDKGKDGHGRNPKPYTGPVPIVTHLHGAHTTPESDGYPEAWYLPSATNVPPTYAMRGTLFDQFDRTNTEPGTAVFQYPNDQRATTLWYHDHTLGITRLNVYAGLAGFYLIRGGPDDLPTGVLPGPAPAAGDPPGMRYYEIPIVIQDRSFKADGSLFYPDNRAYFEGLQPEQLRIPFISEETVPAEGVPQGDHDDIGGAGAAHGRRVSDIPPIWNPEFFGNAIMVNGRTWPYLEVEPRRYRFRLLNGSNSRFLVLRFNREDLSFWQIGNDGGFLPAPVELKDLVLAPAERADVIVDFSRLKPGDEILLLNLGPDEPFMGFNPDGTLSDGEGGVLPAADPETTGQVMKFIVTELTSEDTSTPPAELKLPAVTDLGTADVTRPVTLNEAMSETVFVVTDEEGNIVETATGGEPFGPRAAYLGILGTDGARVMLGWDEPLTENPELNATEIWEIYNFTMDAHPIHLHMVMFQVVNRQALDDEGRPVGAPESPHPWEAGYKDTVIAYPRQVTRIKARFDLEGLFVWHCHILEHEDNEMMRPYYVGLIPEDLKGKLGLS
jgi:bilirubin oxidase